MKRAVLIILLLLALSPVEAVGKADAATDSLMHQLDRVIALRPEYQRKKELRLRELQNTIDTCTDLRKKFDLLGELYTEYHPYNTDSAYSTTMRLEALARKIGDPVLISNAMMNRANILCATGMYHETLGIIDSIKLDGLPDYLQPYYYHTKRTVYGLLADYAAFEKERQHYKRLTDMYRDSLLMVNAPESITYALVKADQLNVQGRPKEAVDIIRKYIDNHDIDEHGIAVFAWTLAESYSLLGDTEQQKKQLIISAIADMKSAVREYISLRQLAIMLYGEGDLDRAYQYMNIAVEDAAKCNARQRIVEINESYPQINAIYVEAVKQKQKDLLRTIVVITVLVVILLVLLLIMRKQMHRISRARRQVEEANSQLSQLNDELQQSNRRLADAYNEIADISELKETYISRYMDQCLFYIEKLDSYRKSISKLANSGKSDDLKKLVKSSTMIDEELKAFYDQFDHTFLSLFPSFVEDFNALLQPEEQILPKRPGTLNTELRIYALVRLGITDSDKIAKFLRYSLTTIYNYRTKVRNKALGDRNTLEARIMNISRRQKVD